MSGNAFGLRGSLAAGVLAVLYAAGSLGAADVPGSASAAPPPNASEDIRDIRGPKSVLPAWLVPVLIAAGAAIALSAYGVWRWQRSRRRTRALLPFEVALRRLDEIRPLMQTATTREFSIAVSDIVRTYIEQRFDVTATHRTTEEFLHDLLESTNALLSVHRPLLSEFLNQCDLAKFGGVSLSPQSMESLDQSARAFVNATAPAQSA